MLFSTRLRNVVLSGVALLGLFVLFWRAQEIDIEKHSHFLNEIQQLKQWDMTLNQHVLEVRSGLLSDYTSITAAAAALEQLQLRLRQVPSFLKPPAQKELIQLLNVYAVALAQKDKTIEQFTAQHVQLHSALGALPVLITKTASAVARERTLTASLHDLLRDILLYVSSGKDEKDEILARIRTRVESLQTNKGDAEMRRVADHVTTILRAQPKVDALLGELLSFPTLAHAENFSTTYNQYYEAAREAVDTYRLGLFGCGLIVVGYLAWALFKRLRDSSAAVKQSEERMALAMQGSQDGLWEQDLEVGSLYLSPRFKAMLGYEEHEFAAGTEQLEKLLHPEDQAYAKQAMADHLEYRTPYEAEFRMQTKNGEYRWFHVYGQALWDKAGKASRMAGSIHDISERKWAEEKLRAGAEVLASSIEQIMTSLMQLAKSESATASAVAQTATTVEEFKQAAHLSDQKVREVSANARQTMQISEDGIKAVERAINGMNLVREQMTEIAKSVVQLGKKGETIGVIIDTVTDLADQSNLLAINAAMQAAKAGEQGKGFAVVAEEVRTLSDQSKQAAEQVQAILTEIQQASSLAVRVTGQGTQSAEAGVQQSVEAGDSIRVLSRSIGDAAEAAQQIAASNREQVVGVDQVTFAIESVKKASLQSLAGTQQIEKAIQNLHGVGQTLTQLIDQYTRYSRVRQTEVAG